MLKYENFHTLNEDNSSLTLDEELDEIFVEYKGDDNEVPICIDHRLNFSELSLQPTVISCC